MRSRLLDQVETLREGMHAVGFQGPWIADYRSGKLLVSPEASAMLPFAAARLSDPITLSDYGRAVHPEDLDWMEALRDKSGPSGQLISEYRLIDEQGQIRWLQCHRHGVFDRYGQLVSSRGVAFDVTAFKADGDSVQTSPHAPFAHPINHLTDGLLTASKAAREMGHVDIERSVTKLLGTAARILAGRIIKAVH